MDIKGNMKDAILDVVFGDHGFFEAENKQDLEEKMNNAITLLSKMGKQCLPRDEFLNNNVLGRRQFSGKLSEVVRGRLTISVIHK